MKKDKKWLKEEIYSMYPSYNETYKNPDDITVAKVDLIDDFIRLINQLDEPEKQVIPQFVANWIDEFSLKGSNPLKVYEELSKDFSEGWTTDEDARVYHWISRNSENTDCFIDSLRYGYEIERND